LFDDIEIETTYRPSRREDGWLADALREFVEDGVLTDVLYAVGGGKEANVYCCRGGPAVEGRLVAAKVYRPHKFRELHHDAIYRQGRGLLDLQGHRDRRNRRSDAAVRKGSKRGKELVHVSWVMHEYAVLEQLWEIGGSVPEPIASSRNAVLMEFFGDEHGAAPTLDRVRPDPEQAPGLLAEALRNVELLIRLGWVHGDLSPYNLMLWEGRLALIDLPQVASLYGNPDAVDLLLRDIERVARFFDRSADPRRIADELWTRVFPTEDGLPEAPITR